MDKRLEQSLLYDFYGELLTEHQKEIYQAYVSDDLSFSEIAEQCKITRQGVHDLIKRCNKTLSGYEEKLHLVERFIHIKDKVGLIKTLVEQSKQETGSDYKGKIIQISDEILEEL